MPNQTANITLHPRIGAADAMLSALLERRRRVPLEPETVPENLVRLSVGIEHVEDLWTDLDAALQASQA